ncbi:MAG: DNA mismatch repair endonuclease MutL [Anaerolineae bacterium]|nr:DNA mismatch repair endonuclease MutL [Anaerolineae bacterium]
MPIKILPENVASRIAAGEVVERPASVVKELVENSLDAQASRIAIETIDGGNTLISIRDNGTGIPADEVALAFRRYATSKLETAADLDAIETLGFRGEALSSIASVSKTTCTTRFHRSEIGVRIRLEGGNIISTSPVGRPPGTEIIIEDLFYNVPARRKFLHTERTERSHIDAFITRYAIAYPYVAFTLTHNGREYLNTTGSGNAREALLQVYGDDLGSALLEIPERSSADLAITVRGFVGPSNVHRANRGYITLFINGRWIQNLRLNYAIIQAYRTLLPVKRFPVAFMMLDITPEDVDVNVHPTKSEVRFRDGDSVFRMVQRTVRETIIEQAPEAVQWHPTPSLPAGQHTGQPSEAIHMRLSGLRPSSPLDNTPVNTQQSDSVSSRASPSIDVGVDVNRRENSRQLPPLRVIGQISTMFIVAEGPDGLYLIDQHAAHERVLYERMLADWMTGTLPSQPLLEPQAVVLPAEEAGIIESVLPVMEKLGMDVEPFGPRTFLVRAVPAILTHIVPGDLLVDIAAEQPDQPSTIQVNREEMLIRLICKRAAIKAGQMLSHEEMARLVMDLESAENPRTCPHGRPTIVQISTEDLAHQFRRG